MAKELDLKKVELKVFINCCDGCKRKTKKVLCSIEGVLKTEIDPLQPKVTVIGDVDPQILIKKLSKAGKQAELWKQPGNSRDTKLNKQGANKTDEKQKSESGYEELTKCRNSSSCSSGSGCSAAEEIVQKEIPDSQGNEGSAQYQKEISSGTVEVTKNQNAILSTSQEDLVRTMLCDAVKVRTCSQHCCMAEPPQIVTLPYREIHSYAAAAAPLQSTCCAQANYQYYETAVHQTQFQAPTSQVGDYFSDENTVGCSVM